MMVVFPFGGGAPFVKEGIGAMVDLLVTHPCSVPCSVQIGAGGEKTTKGIKARRNHEILMLLHGVERCRRGW